jgi:hypothetical protein
LDRREAIMSNTLRAEIHRLHHDEMLARAEAHRRARQAAGGRDDGRRVTRPVAFAYRRALAAVALSVLFVLAFASLGQAHPMGAGDGATLPGQSPVVPAEPTTVELTGYVDLFVVGGLVAVLLVFAAIVLVRRHQVEPA